MLWILVGYALVGVIVSIWLPVSLASTRAKIEATRGNLNPELMARLTPDQRKQVEQLKSIAATNFTTGQIVIAGLLWPLQIVGFIWSRRLSKQIRDANRCDCGRC